MARDYAVKEENVALPTSQRFAIPSQAPTSQYSRPASTHNLTQAQVLHLHRTIGNQAVIRSMSQRHQHQLSAAQPGTSTAISAPAVQRDAEPEPCEDCDDEETVTETVTSPLGLTVGAPPPDTNLKPGESETAFRFYEPDAVIQRQVTLPPTPDPDCIKLLQEIRDFLYGGNNIKKGLIQRAKELIDDLENLQWDFWNTPHPQFGSVEGHQQQFNDQQRGLRNRIEKSNSKNCDDPDGLMEIALEWSTKPTPVPLARPRPVAPRVQEDEGINWSSVWSVLKWIGLGIVLVGVVVLALMAAVPAAALAAAALSIAAIAMVLGAFGKSGNNGGGGQMA